MTFWTEKAFATGLVHYNRGKGRTRRNSRIIWDGKGSWTFRESSSGIITGRMEKGIFGEISPFMVVQIREFWAKFVRIPPEFQGLKFGILVHHFLNNCD